ncbi:hypothetical protein [Aquamicrobium soli]|jgi:hypothetical protein|uniref:Cardiac phospholamban n=1 Tax=Aquamicrobium soli TaxID=1811518 RepID=A0ABV7K3W4_9HYPH
MKSERWEMALLKRRIISRPSYGTKRAQARSCAANLHREIIMNGIIYLVGLIVIIMFILSFLGLR